VFEVLVFEEDYAILVETDDGYYCKQKVEEYLTDFH